MVTPPVCFGFMSRYDRVGSCFRVLECRVAATGQWYMHFSDILGKATPIPGTGHENNLLK